MSALDIANVVEPTAHPSNHRVVGLLQRIIWGQEASGLWPCRADASLHLLPVFTWAHSLIDVGRKDWQAPNLPRYLLPVRLSSPCGHVVLASSRQDIQMHARGMGHDCKVSGVVDPGIPSLEPVEEMTGFDLGVVGASARGYLRVRRSLHSLIQDGQAAHVELVEYLERGATTFLHKAERSKIEELRLANNRLFDPIKFESVVGEVMFGSDNRKALGLALIERCLKPETFIKVDPSRYIAVNLRRSCRDVVSSVIGDPRVGPKFRLFFRTLDPNTPLEEAARRYRDEYPTDQMSADLASACLKALSIPDIHMCPLDGS